MSDGPRAADDSPAGPGTDGAPEAGSAHEQGSASRMILRAFMENKLAVVGVGLVVLITLFCFVGPLFWHTDQLHANLLATDQPPGKGHPLGTDDSGFDVLGRLMVGGQSSLEVGFAVALISTGFGVVYGTIAGYLSGLTDTILMRFVDVILAIPIIYLFIDLASIFRPTLLLLILVLALLSWMGPARLVRGETLSLRTREYVQAARAMGEGAPRIVVRHLVPNVIGTIVVNATFQVADAILTLAVLSYLGFSLPPPAATWGGMLENGVNFMYDGYWWQIYPAAVMIVLTVMAFNIIGDAVRDSLGVRLQKR
ncbi:MAG: ABC transporter permease [Acidimicrobiales bacterium]